MTPQEAYSKAYSKAYILGLRIPELEGIILKDAKYSYLYAFDVIKGKWEIAEPIISKDVYSSYLYAKNIIKGKWELGEPAISKNACCSYCYALYVIKGRLPDLMHNQMILENNEYTKNYVKLIQ